MAETHATAIERADFVAVPVTDVARSRRFYSETLGLPCSDGAWPEVSLGNISLYLIDPRQMGAQFEGPHTAAIALRVADVAAARAALETRGIAFAGEILDTGVCHMAFFNDPDGNALMLHRRYAKHEDGREP